MDPRALLLAIIVGLAIWAGEGVVHVAKKVGHAIVHVFKKDA